MYNNKNKISKRSNYFIIYKRELEGKYSKLYSTQYLLFLADNKSNTQKKKHLTVVIGFL